ncbi:response regulator [Desulfomarina sp.]
MLRKVLLVDDDPILLTAMEAGLSTFRHSFEVITANDGFEAVKILEETAVSLVVIDLVMVRMDGISLLQHVREHYPDISVIIISAMEKKVMQELASGDDIAGYLSKPFDISSLSQMILTPLKDEARDGIMHNITPAVFLQLMEMDAKTCTIRILDKMSPGGGILYFLDGNLLDVRIGRQTGIEAAYTLFTWDEVTIFIKNSCAPRTNNINSGLQPIIMKAAGMKDESHVTVFAREDPEDTSGNPALPLLKKLSQYCEDGLLPLHNRATTALEQMIKLGEDYGFGRFRAGYLKNEGKNDRVIIAEKQPVMLTVKTSTEKKKIDSFFSDSKRKQK